MSDLTGGRAVVELLKAEQVRYMTERIPMARLGRLGEIAAPVDRVMQRLDPHSVPRQQQLARARGVGAHVRGFPVGHHRAQLFAFVVEEALLFRSQRGRRNGEQLRPVGPAGEQVAIPPHGSGLDRVAFRLRAHAHPLSRAFGGENFRFQVERRAVLELDPGLELEGIGQPVLGDVPGARETGDELVGAELLRHQPLGELAYVAREAPLHDRRVLPREDQDARGAGPGALQLVQQRLDRRGAADDLGDVDGHVARGQCAETALPEPTGLVRCRDVAHGRRFECR